ncbi:MAG TPA: hypothetical protein VHK64_08500 [Nocardioidaceae bacterium]|nr:hypothetical protein [Nocardioidaceae bacterium]
MTTPAVRFGYAVVVAFFACLAIALSGVAYTNHVQKQADRRSTAERADSDRRWCALLSDLDEAYNTPPGPTTELGRKVASEIHRLRVGFRCS